MLSTTPQQLKKLERLAKVLDNGDIALLTELDTLESRLEGIEGQLPKLREAKDGEVGPMGPQGEPGESIVGPMGPAGRDGVDGRDSTVPGPQGPKGEKGDTVVGPAGKDGADGFVDDATIAYLEDEIKRVEASIPEKAKETNFGFVIRDVVAGSGVTIDKSDPNRPIITATGGGGASWGDITGTLSDQTDLQTALDAKIETVKYEFGITVDGAGNALTTGSKGFRYIQEAGTITGWHLIADQPGDIVFDVQRNSVSLAGTEKPTLSTQSENSDLALSTWTTSLVAGDIIEFIIDSASTVTRATLTILVTK